MTKGAIWRGTRRGRPADALTAITAGLCPICGAGPFVVPAQHVSQKHFLNKRELRDLLGVPHNASICDPAYSASWSEALRRRGQPQFGPRTASISQSAAAGLSALRRRQVAALREKITNLYDGGRSPREIATELDLHIGTVWRALRATRPDRPISITDDDRERRRRSADEARAQRVIRQVSAIHSGEADR